ncbi:hypothetical protein [Glycomyces buryatensis]|uniref:Uncharacterized protein n=1 Tax=Glycomyces buryatensis TaxID=2570927 RepID=A0A4S8QBP3_9ACTN|nr:hypothetical protein [Glycomyces buryatensis]THV40235.1 hypothetical protein FAB82_16220 [Glycomyces buryatensis]
MFSGLTEAVTPLEGQAAGGPGLLLGGAAAAVLIWWFDRWLESRGSSRWMVAPSYQPRRPGQLGADRQLWSEANSLFDSQPEQAPIETLVLDHAIVLEASIKARKLRFQVILDLVISMEP